MDTITRDIPEAERLASVRRAGLLVTAGWLLLATGVLLAGWAPVELPLGLVGLGAAALALLWPSQALPSNMFDALYSLTLASLITLSGFHLLA
ncbi:MAG: hypothetical protein RI841_01400 [Halomonas sp.]|uniref:hypothetical protein n=1 Tax=Halomonas sp. TaxID=1486246 RepID=UPI0028705DA0|nr:hypothetical protein [Halomonas sp.]MDR9438149.1 hypothetical protein [Halomonas sp.]